jgi:hypothetical protein
VPGPALVARAARQPGGAWNTRHPALRSSRHREFIACSGGKQIFQCIVPCECRLGSKGRTEAEAISYNASLAGRARSDAVID